MKYLKIFEYKKPSFVKGDLVRIVDHDDTNKNDIFEIISIQMADDKIYNRIRSLNRMFNITLNWYLDSSLRYLTPEELERFKLEMDANKYNI